MLIIFNKTSPDSLPLIQASPKRDWMDATLKKHAYHCLPLTLANTNGWVMELAQDVVVYWEGGNAETQIISGSGIYTGTPGIVAFNIGWFIEAPGCDVTYGPLPNYFFPDASCLSASVDGEWPEPVLAQWLLKPGKEITFKQSMPVCFISIQPKYLLEEMQYEIKEKWNDAEYLEQRKEYGKAKQEIKLGNPPLTKWMKGIRNLRTTLPKLPTIK